MNLAPAEIDRIVAEVVRRLAVAVPRAGQAVSAAPVAAEPVAVTLGLPVITLESLAGLGAAKQLFVLPHAVVTPAVRDELKKRGVELIRAAANQAPDTKSVRLLFALAGDTASRANDLKGLAGIERIESHGSAALSGLVAETLRHVSRRQLPALVLAREAYAAANEFARQGCPAVALVATAADVATAHAETGATVFIVPAAKAPAAALRQLVQAIVALPIRSSPAAPR